jgi:hypothetical protein
MNFVSFIIHYVADVDDRELQNRIVEVFFDTQTCINQNLSWFGKYIQLNYFWRMEEQRLMRFKELVLSELSVEFSISSS